jgi:16S rRNA (uracil1498-N3)-methyltransferase
VGAPVFLVDGQPLAAGAVVVVDGPEGHHAATVQRLRTDEAVVLTDGEGTRGHGVVVAVAKDRLEVRVDEVTVEPQPAPRLVVVQALVKGDRGELAVATLTEVGVDVVVPWSAARSVARWDGPRGEKALARWRSTARESAKQSRRARLPEVTPLASTVEVAQRLGRAAAGVVLHEEARARLATLDVPAAGDVVVVVGPEGGLAPNELVRFAAAGASTYRLGPTVLRASTAGSAALAVLLARTARWG